MLRILDTSMRKPKDPHHETLQTHLVVICSKARTKMSKYRVDIECQRWTTSTKTPHCRKKCSKNKANLERQRFAIVAQHGDKIGCCGSYSSGHAHLLDIAMPCE